MFVEFIALIFLSELQKRMRSAKLFEKHTLQGILDELDFIECFQALANKPHTAEITNSLHKYEILVYLVMSRGDIG